MTIASVNHLIIDGQLLQTTAWDRGMGKYILALLEAYAAAHTKQPITVIVNQNLEFADERRAHLSRIMPQADFVSLDLPGLSGNVDEGKRRATKSLDAYISSRHGSQLVDFLVLNLFTFDYCAAFPTNARKLLLFFDLIPMLYWDEFSKYFGTYLYFAHFKTIFEADVIFSISEATRQQLINLLGVNPALVTNLSGAYIARESVTNKAAEHSITGRYFLLPSANFPHKNNLNAIKAFAAVNEVFGNTLSLVITSSFSEDTQQQLGAYSEGLVFVGSVSDEELDGLYKHAELVLFPSLVEGLGLPVLEAVSYGKPVVCSSIEVFEEISKKAFYFCDSENPASIHDALIAAYTRHDWEAKQSLYAGIESTFTWRASAEVLAKRLDDHESASTSLAPRKRPQVAILSPSPSIADSTVARKVQSTYGFLRAKVKASYYVVHNYEDPLQSADFLSVIDAVHDGATFKHHSKSAITLYAVDDSLAAAEIVLAAIARPGSILLDTKHLDRQFTALVGDRRLPAAVVKQAIGDRLTHKDCVAFLQRLGNTIIPISELDGRGEDGGWYLGEALLPHIKKGSR